MKSRSFRVVLVAIPIAVLAAVGICYRWRRASRFPWGYLLTELRYPGEHRYEQHWSTRLGIQRNRWWRQYHVCNGNGSSATANTYSYGTTNSSDRAFGALDNSSGQPSSQVQSTIGVQFQNNVGRPIGSLAISYACEQWRLGAWGLLTR